MLTGLLLIPAPHRAASEKGVLPPDSDAVWFSPSKEGRAQIHFYFFWSETCPHCRRAKPFVKSLASSYSWLKVHSLEVSAQPENAQKYVAMAESLGRKARGVPAFMFCGQMHVGYSDETTTGAFLKNRLKTCYQTRSQTGVPIEEEPAFSLPWIGTLNLSDFSLPVITVMLAGLDAFNPCAFFVLLFLLSLLIHAQSRARLLLVGGTFVFCSGLFYFLFMTAWLNLFLAFGELRVLTLIAGALALVMGGLNIKGFFRFLQGPTLSIPESAKPGLFERMTRLVRTPNLPSLLMGTLTLSVVANAYEFLCTAGFPMVFTRILTLNQLPLTTYYLYLVFYCLIYVIPLALIVMFFFVTLGSRKLQEREGRLLKLFSGLLMAGLGLILMVNPGWLNQIWTAGGLLILSGVLTYLGFRFFPQSLSSES